MHMHLSINIKYALPLIALTRNEYHLDDVKFYDHTTVQEKQSGDNLQLKPDESFTTVCDMDTNLRANMRRERTNINGKLVRNVAQEKELTVNISFYRSVAPDDHV